MKSNSRKFSLLVFPDFSRSILIGNLSLFAISLPCLAVLLSPPLFLKQKQRRPAHSRKTNAAARPLQHEDNSSDEEYLYTVSNDNDKSSKRSPVVNVVVEGILTGFFQKKFTFLLSTKDLLYVQILVKQVVYAKQVVLKL